MSHVNIFDIMFLWFAYLTKYFPTIQSFQLFLILIGDDRLWLIQRNLYFGNWYTCLWPLFAVVVDDAKSHFLLSSVLNIYWESGQLIFQREFPAKFAEQTFGVIIIYIIYIYVPIITFWCLLRIRAINIWHFAKFYLFFPTIL